MNKYSNITEDNIKVLVDSFYLKVQKDEQLGSIFNRVIDDWQPHLNKMYNFWSSVMLQTGKYKGNPIGKHKNIMPFDKNLFQRWLALFAETSKEIFDEKIAGQFIFKSENIARSMQYMLYEYPDVKNSGDV